MKSIFWALAILISAYNCNAKDLTHRLGVGFKNNTSLDLPALAVVYYPSHDLALTGGVGIDSKKDYSSSLIDAGARYIIYPENNLNFYTAAQLAIVSYENPADGRQNGIEAAAVFGVEFFLNGLENLAFTFEAGAALSTAKNSRFRTLGNDPLRAGLIFYF
jgi:hypothetical protein